MQQELKKNDKAVPEQEDMNDEQYEALIRQEIEDKVPLTDLSEYINF